MKKILQVTTPLAFVLFFISFITFQTTRMPKPASINIIEIMLGKDFSTGGVVYNSGFNMYAMLALVLAAVAIAGAWLLKNIPMRLVTGIASVGSLFCLSHVGGAFADDVPFVEMLNASVKGGVEFTTTMFFALIIAMLLFNIVFCVATNNFSKNMLKYKWFFLMLLPTLLFFVVFAYIPMAGISIAFMDYNIKDIFKSTWAGLKWFEYLAANFSGDLGQVIINTLIVAAGKLLIGFPAPIILALMLNECRQLKFKKVIQTVSYLPHFVSWSIVGGLIISLASSDNSIVNGIIKVVQGGTRGFYLLNEAQYIRWTLILSNVWKNMGWGTIIYMAALTGINPELYESAVLDGAGKLSQIRHITLPGISNIITLQLILTAPSLLSDNYDQTMNLVYPTTVTKGKTLSMYIYEIGVRGAGQLGMSGNYSYSTVIGLCNSLISMALLVLANQIGKRINEEGAIW